MGKTMDNSFLMFFIDVFFGGGGSLNLDIICISIYIDSGMNLTSTDLLCLSCQCHHSHIQIDVVETCFSYISLS